MQRAFRPLGSILFVSIAGLLTSCATMRDSDRAAYFDAAYDDHNRAPASLTPPAPSSDGGSTIDPLYMRTQADYQYSLGEAFSNDGNRQKAIEAFKMVLVYDPEAPAVRLRLATEYLKAGFLSEAVEQAGEAVKQNPKNIDAHLLLGGLYSTMKSFDKAVGHYESVLKIDPNNAEAPLYLGAVWSEQKQPEKAVKSFESLTKNTEYANVHLAWYYIGRVRMEQKDEKYQKAAEAAFKKALTIKPDHSDSVIALGSLYNKRHQEDKALRLFADFQKEHGPSGRIAEILAQYYVEKGKYDDAYEQFEVLEANSDDPLAVKLKMALILIEKKMYDKATTKLEDILREAPDSDKIRFYLAAVYEESNQDEKAVAQFKKIQPDSSYYDESVIHAAYLLKGKGKLDDAIALVENGLKSKGDHAQMYAMYASLLDEKGDYKKALTSLEGAIEKYPENAQLRFYYGTVQDRVGNKDLVVKQMQKVIELDPNHVQGLNYLAFTWAEEDKNLEEAEKLARRAIELEPKDGYILDTLGWILFKRGEAKESLRYLEAAHRHQPTVSVIAEHLGDAYMRLSLVEKALGMYHKALELETDSKKLQDLRSKITAAGTQRPPRDERTPASAK